MNRSVLLDLIRAEERISRSELARRSGLTKPTVSAIVDLLMQEGVVREVGYAGSVSAGGRPARLLEFNVDAAAYLGIEFGVDETAIAVSDGRGNIRHVTTAPAVLRDPERTLGGLPELVAAALRSARVPKARVQAVGVTVPGLVDQTSGACRFAPNLGWQDFPLRDAVERALKRPVVVLNITQAAAIAEGRLGAAQGVDSFIWMFLGAGVGAGIVLGGRAFTGTRGFAGEIGHCQVSDDDVPCGCGKTGHLEAFASSMAVLRAAQFAALEHPDSLLAEFKPLSDISQVVSAVKDGDATAHAVLQRVGDSVGRGAAYLVNLFDPKLVVLGGSVAAAGDVLVQSVSDSLKREAMSPDAVRVAVSTLGDRAGLIGAVLVAMDRAVRSYRVVSDGVGPAEVAAR